MERRTIKRNKIIIEIKEERFIRIQPKLFTDCVEVLNTYDNFLSKKHKLYLKNCIDCYKNLMLSHKMNVSCAQTIIYLATIKGVFK